VNFIVSKCIKYYGKRLVKLSSIIAIGLLIIALFICVKYKPLYKVTLDGKVIGYVEDKDKMQEKIEKFANNLEGNITSIKVEVMPVYELELVSNVKESETKEQEVNGVTKPKVEVVETDDGKFTIKASDETKKLVLIQWKKQKR